jgi:redox-sensitive bicupin YhaK (pirin superfamily)
MSEVSESSILEQWMLPHQATIGEQFPVGRVLPYRGGRGVGPFVFLDHMGPHEFSPGADADVGPHPHIGLSTLTYLLEGEIVHRDSLGSVQAIRPGDVNWMTAGSGVVHSERIRPELREKGFRMHGFQAWVALPKEFEEVAPSFSHHSQESLAKAGLITQESAGVKSTLIAGSAFGMKSPVPTYSRLFYVHSQLKADARLGFETEGQEAAFYLIDGTVRVEDQTYTGPGLLHFKPGVKIEFQALTIAQGLLLGGDPLPEHRRIWWNFVSSSPERLELAKTKWREQKFHSAAEIAHLIAVTRLVFRNQVGSVIMRACHKHHNWNW